MMMIKNQPEKKYPSVQEATDTERIGMVKDIFKTIIRRYDFLNHFLSLRRDIAWRRFAVRRMHFFRTNRLLDAACGTGDLAIGALSRYPRVSVVGLDFVKEMLDAAALKTGKKNLSSRIEFVNGDATALPFAESSFDVAGIAFGIRNIPDRMGTLKEMARAVVPGGQVMVLEITPPRGIIIRGCYRFYLNRILPRLARAFTSNPAAYLYLADSVMNFPAPEQFATLMEEAGLTMVKKYPLTLGVTYLYTGIKPGLLQATAT